MPVHVCGCQETGGGWHNRLAAWLLAQCSRLSDRKLHDRKERLFAYINRNQGVCTVLEIGIGAAPNLHYYGTSVDCIVGVDRNPAVEGYALQAAAAAGLPPDRLRLVQGSAEQLPLEDESVDAVVATHVLCSVSSPQRTLAEARRVLKPGGRYIFIEHVAASPPTSRLATLQRLVAPLVRWVADGCNVDRDSLATIQEAGFSGVQAEQFWLDVPAPTAFWSPHICGTAIK